MLYRTFLNTPVNRLGGPFGELNQMRRRMEQLFDNIDNRRQARVDAGVYPAINIIESADAYTISAELPGVRSEDLELDVTANQLTLAGERKISPAAQGARYHRREREAGRFSRAIALSGDLDPDNARAKLADGVLTITVPKAEKAKPKKISVQ